MQTKNFDGFKYQLGALYFTDSNEAMTLVDIELNQPSPFVFKYPMCSENRTFHSKTATVIDMPIGKKEDLGIALDDDTWYMCVLEDGVIHPMLHTNAGYWCFSQNSKVSGQPNLRPLYKMNRGQEVK